MQCTKGIQKAQEDCTYTAITQKDSWCYHGTNTFISTFLQSLHSYWNTSLRISQVLSKSRVASLSLTIIWPTLVAVFYLSSRTRGTVNVPDKSQDIKITVNIKSSLQRSTMPSHCLTTLWNLKFSICFPFRLFDREWEKLLNKLQAIN